MKLKVYNSTGSSFVEKEFNIPTFEGEDALLTLKAAVVGYQANQRLGTHKTKHVGEVSGSGKKPFRQKGTGGARQGTLRAVQMPGGGVAHGPKPRDYSHKINKKVKHLALQRAIFDRAAAGEIAVIQNFEVPASKTKSFKSLVDKISTDGKILIVDESWNQNVALAARNISRVFMVESANINALDFCHYSTILVSEKGMESILKRVNA
jgi:large subunit ribosomal protein L4